MRGARPLFAGGALVALAFAVGPRARFEGEPRPVTLPDDLDAYLLAAEASVPDLRPEARRGITWSRLGPGVRAPVAVVYLHGFSADRNEIEPVPSRVAAALGGSVYYARLRGHGRDGAAMAEATTAGWAEDVSEALAIGARLGEQVLVMGTSTGGTLAVWAGAQDLWKEELLALVLLSPNFQPRNRTSRVLLWPWGGTLVRTLIGAERCWEPENEAQARLWTTCYPSRALLPMMALVEHVRTLDLGRVTTPTLVLQDPQDQVVDVAEGRRAYDALGAGVKRWEEVGGVGDPSHHVLAGDALSPQTTDWTVDRIVGFVNQVLKP